MGLTHVTTVVRDLAKTGKPYEAEFLVDTGAIDCLVPAEALHETGVIVERNNVYEAGHGRNPVPLEIRRRLTMAA